MTTRIEQLRALEAKATTAPWHPGCLHDDNNPCNCKSILSETCMGAVASVDFDNGLRVGEGGNDAPPIEEAKANQEFIAEMRNALPGMIEVMEKMAEALEEIKELDGELNPNNYDHEDVIFLNEQFIDAYKISKEALAAFTKWNGEKNV